MAQYLSCGRFRIDLSRPRIMGIVNLTDDSFSGDGHRGDAGRAIEHGLRLVEEGADLLDLGAESSRPGAEPVNATQELSRLLSVLDGLRGCGVPLSVDTVKPEVMREVILADADLINDIAALTAPGALEVVAPTTVAVCLMHMRGEPATMQQAPAYDDVVRTVRDFLEQRVAACLHAGISGERLLVDPGFGFGKTLAHNLELLRRLGEVAVPPAPTLVGLSRKSMIREIVGGTADDRTIGSVAAALLAVMKGARIVRTHDVVQTRQALAVWQAVENG